MLSVLDLTVVAAVAALSSLLGSVAGTGGTAVLLPVLVLYFGIQQAVPIITLANLTANLSRVWFNRRELDLPVVGWFTLGCLPLVTVGTYLFTISAPELVTRCLGALMLGTVIWRRVRPRPPRRHRAVWFLPLGAGFGFLSGYMTGTGPLMAPFYMAYGLARGAYIGTDALATVFMQSTKVGVLGWRGFLTVPVLVNGLILVPFMVLGAGLGKHLLDRVSERFFFLLIEAVMVVAGVGFLIRG